MSADSPASARSGRPRACGKPTAGRPVAPSRRAPQDPDRLASLDGFRGLAVAGMILVNNPGSWDHVYAPLRHAEWHGATPTDLIFPFFLFGVGASMSFSFAARRARGDSRAALWRHGVRRSAVIYLLGLLMAAYPHFDLATVRLTGVLARIALAYLAAATLVLFLSRRAVAGAAAVLLAGYWALLALAAVPGFGPGDLSPEGNLAAYLDRLLLGPHIWRGGGGVYDPEGALSTLPAVASVLGGLFAGDFLRAHRRGGASAAATVPSAVGRHGADGRASLAMVLAGAALIAGGLAWNVVLPVNKPLWTSSYVAWSTGWALVVLAVLHWVVDVRGWRKWARPLVAYGANPILVFVASGLLAKQLIAWSLYSRIYEAAFASWAGPVNGSLAFAGAAVVLWLAVAWVLHARRILIKV